MSTLPSVPVKHRDFLQYVQSKSNAPIGDLVKPYIEYDAVLRRVFAQEPSHPAIQDNYLNLVPLYDSAGSTNASVRARDLDSEPPELKDKYILPLDAEDRKPNGSPAVVPSVPEFQNNFNIFTEGSLSDIDWSNVVVAGSAVVTCLMPVPEEFRLSKRSLRQFYHEKFAPASDVDLFLYGLTEDQAIEKIKQIEERVKGSILYETTTVRTKNTITIVSQYPTRHIQIVLRIYKSVSEILTGFDVDCACAAYDGKQVYVAPRALTSYITQTNQIDLTRRSPSYENRLSKYSHRGFEVFWPGLERSRIDPTVFERSFARTVGLARLLVLEKLPSQNDRDQYVRQRRQERGRPAPRDVFRNSAHGGNIKDQWEDEAPEWLEEDEISDYNTFTIPYGKTYYARKIEKLLYKKDLLLNAEWNRPESREVNLHRHPAFFGNAEDVIRDCCGCCPQPTTEEEKQVAEEESKIYISGNMSFIKDDPGRQEIGSFNPITETDWTEMAYVGNTERLCQAIVDHNLEEVREWLSQESSDPNIRDHAGRTPLQLACMTSTPEIVQCLVDHGARMIARIADGRTALHIAAARGDTESVRILLTKSEQNEEEESRKGGPKKASESEGQSEEKAASDQDDQSDVIMVDDDASRATSFVKVDRDAEEITDGASDEDPDIYDINVVSWDNHTSPLHLAILNGHVDVVEMLVGSFGADALLPIKLLQEYDNTPRAAILTLALALRLSPGKAKAMTEELLQLGASPAQADLKGCTPLHYLAASGYSELVDVYLQQDQAGVKRAINHLAFPGSSWGMKGYSAFTTAVAAGDAICALKLLDAGAAPAIGFDAFIKSAQMKYSRLKRNSSEENHRTFGENTWQPIIAAVEKDMPLLALDLLARGTDPNTLSREGFEARDSEYSRRRTVGTSLLDCVRAKLAKLRSYNGEPSDSEPPNPLDPDDNTYLKGIEEGTYKMWTGRHILKQERSQVAESQKTHETRMREAKDREGLAEKMAAVKGLVSGYERLECALLEKRAKTFKRLFPDIEGPYQPETDRAAVERSRAAPFEVSFTFKVPDLTEVKRDGYMRLFEAAWCGDLDTIKSLTLSKWGPQNNQLPLQIAVEDKQDFSPFSIAVLRGHLQVARSILRIVEAQYKPRGEETAERYRLDEDLDIYSEIIDEKYTIDNIGEVAAEVECNVAPLTVLQWDCPVFRFIQDFRDDPDRPRPRDLMEYAVYNDNVELLAFLLELGQDIRARGDPEKSVYRVPRCTFDKALRLGRVRCLAEIIRRTGGDLPIKDLVRRSGVQIQEKPKYYQGLTIHGKKRPDWASEGRGHYRADRTTSPPLLNAAFAGSLESTEWFLGTSPGRCYNEFTERYKHDKRLQILAQSKLGVEGSVMKWLGSRNNLVLHCAVLSRETDESERLVQYLAKEYPSCLEAKSVEGYTPLQLALSLKSQNFARILINAGANQAIRDATGRNLIHIILCGTGGRHTADANTVRKLVGLLDLRLVPSMLTERCSQSPGSLTPMAHWMANGVNKGRSNYRSQQEIFDLNNEYNQNIEITRIMLDLAERTGQKHLELLNGAGSTPVHDAVKYQTPTIFRMMVDRRPDLLHREDSTGCTPVELAANLWVNEVTSNPPRMPGPRAWWRGMEDGEDVLNRSPESFVEDKKRTTERQDIYDACRERATSSKRKLVTLYEANEVANRLAAQQRFKKRHSRATGDENEESETDEVKMWHARF